MLLIWWWMCLWREKFFIFSKIYSLILTRTNFTIFHLQVKLILMYENEERKKNFIKIHQVWIGREKERWRYFSYENDWRLKIAQHNLQKCTYGRSSSWWRSKQQGVSEWESVEEEKEQRRRRRKRILSEECYLFHFIVHRVKVAVGHKCSKTSEPIRTELNSHNFFPSFPFLLSFSFFVHLFFSDLEWKIFENENFLPEVMKANGFLVRF